MNALKRLWHSGLVLLAGNLTAAVLSFLLAVLIARYSGDTGFGVYATVLAWLFPFVLLAEAGTSTVIVRNGAADAAEVPALIHRTSSLRLLAGLACWVGLAGLAPWLSDNPEIRLGLRLSAGLVLIEPAFSAYSAALRSQHHMKPVVLLNLAMLTIQLALTSLGFQAGLGVPGALSINVLTSLLRMAAAWAYYRHLFKPVRLPAKHQQPNMLASSGAFAFAGVIGALHLRSGLLLVEMLSTTAVAGVFAAGMRFVEATRIVPQAYFDALLPTLSQAEAPARTRLMHHSLGALLLVGTGIATVLTLLAEPLVLLAFGADFRDAVPILQAGIWLLNLNVMRGLLTLHAYALHQEVFVNRVLLAGLMVRIALSVVLISAFGALGAVFAGGLAELLMCLPLVLAPWDGTRRPRVPDP